MNRTTLLSIYIYIIFLDWQNKKLSSIFTSYFIIKIYFSFNPTPNITKWEKKSFFLFFWYTQNGDNILRESAQALLSLCMLLRLSLKQQKKVTGNSLNFRPFLEFPFQGSLDFRPFLSNTSINQQRIEILESRLVTRGERISPVM